MGKRLLFSIKTVDNEVENTERPTGNRTREPFGTKRPQRMDATDYTYYRERRILTVSGRAIDGSYFSDDCAKAEHLVISSAASIDDWTFAGFSNLRTIALPDNLRKIGTGAFYGCTSLESLRLPESLETLGDWAFGRCTFLRTAEIPETLKTIGVHAFTDCDSLGLFEVPAGTEVVNSRIKEPWKMYRQRA